MCQGKYKPANIRTDPHMPQFSLTHRFSAEHCSLFGKVLYTSLVITLLCSYCGISQSQNNTTEINGSNIIYAS